MPENDATVGAEQPDGRPRMGSAVILSPENLAKLRSELDVVQGNIRVLSEMLTELSPGKEHPSDLELLLDLNKTCRAMQNRVVQLIDRVGNEEVTSKCWCHSLSY